MGEKNKHKKYNYFPLFMGLGLVFGILFDQLAIGLCLGVAVGLATDSKEQK